MTGIFVPWTPGRKNSPGWIEDGSGCHIWLGATSGGYGVVTVAGQQQRVNRVRYEREVGPIPEGMELDHFACDNGAGGCCNPVHCRPASHRENLLRGAGVASAKAARRSCPAGHPYSGAPGTRHCGICAKQRAGSERNLAAQRRRRRTDKYRAKERARRRVVRARGGRV